MPTNLNIYSQVNGVVKGASVSVGSNTSAVTFALTNAQHIEKIIELANATQAVVYDATVDLVAQFNMLVILPSEDLLLELQCDADNDVGTEQFVMQLKADIPFILPSRVSWANYTTAFAAGTPDVIDKIIIRNESGAVNDVRILIFD